MENNQQNRKKLAVLIVSSMDPDRVKTLLALQYMQDLEDEETFQSVLKTIEEAAKQNQGKTSDDSKE